MPNGMGAFCKSRHMCVQERAFCAARQRLEKLCFVASLTHFGHKYQKDAFIDHNFSEGLPPRSKNKIAAGVFIQKQVNLMHSTSCTLRHKDQHDIHCLQGRHYGYYRNTWGALCFRVILKHRVFCLHNATIPQSPVSNAGRFHRLLPGFLPKWRRTTSVSGILYTTGSRTCNESCQRTILNHFYKPLPGG